MQLPRRRKHEKTFCPACQRPVHDRESAVQLHRDLYHARCALYRRRP